MLPIFKFLHRRRPQRYDHALARVENQIQSLENKGVVIDRTDVRMEWRTFPRNRQSLQMSVVLALPNALIVPVACEFIVMKSIRGLIVVDESRSYAAVLQNVGVVIRYDSGHWTHKQYPHTDTEHPAKVAIAPPDVPLDVDIDVARFVTIIDEWRAAEAWQLPPHPPDLSVARIP